MLSIKERRIGIFGKIEDLVFEKLDYRNRVQCGELLDRRMAEFVWDRIGLRVYDSTRGLTLHAAEEEINS